MQAKTIKSVLTKKMNDWISSIEDEDLQKMVRKNTIVTGGCIASMLLKEPVNDYDVYFRNRETALAVAHYYVNRFQLIQKEKGIPREIMVDDSKEDRVSVKVTSSGIASEEEKEEYHYFETRSDEEGTQYVTDLMTDVGEIEDAYEDLNEKAQEITGQNYRPVFMSTNAITLSDKIQLVLRFYGEPDEIHENYDFVHCTNYFDLKKMELKLRKKALEALLARQLTYVGSKYPLCSILRTRKFIKRGWNINAGQYLKMVLQLQELNLKNVEVLRDQLTGVDSAYFTQLIERVQEKDPEKIDSAYLIEIVDRLF